MTLSGKGDPGQVIHAGKGLADVEFLAVAIEIAVVVCRERGIATQ